MTRAEFNRLTKKNEKLVLKAFQKFDIIEPVPNSGAMHEIKCWREKKSEIEHKLDAAIERYRNLWPSGCKGDPIRVRVNVIKALREKHKFRQLMDAAQRHLEQNQMPYCGHADYFLYKTIEGGIACRFKKYLEEENKEPDYSYDDIT